MTYSLSGKRYGCLAAHKIPWFLWNPTFLMFTATYHWELFWTRWIQSIHTQDLKTHFSIIPPPIFLMWFCLSSYHKILQLKFLSQACHMSHLSHRTWFNHPNTEVNKSQLPECHGDYILYGSNYKYGTCSVSHYWNIPFWCGTSFLENLCIPALRITELMFKGASRTMLSDQMFILFAWKGKQCPAVGI